MELSVYPIILSIAGAIIVLLIGVIITAWQTLSKNVSTLLTAVMEIQTQLTERNYSCIDRHDDINCRLTEHDKTLRRHNESIIKLESKCNVE